MGFPLNCGIRHIQTGGTQKQTDQKVLWAGTSSRSAHENGIQSDGIPYRNLRCGRWNLEEVK